MPTTAATRTRKRRPPKPARVVGYLVVVGMYAVGLVLVNVAPGWDALPFLTEDTTLVLTVVNASMVASLAANLVYLVHDPRWLHSLGDAVTAVFSLVAGLRLWEVFPFDFGDTAVDWALVARVLLLVGIVGAAIGIVAGLVGFVRGLGRPD